MIFYRIVGTKFQENSLFEQVQFEVEANLDLYLLKDLHIFFKRVEDGNIVVTEVVEYRDRSELDRVNKASFGIKEWIHITGKRIDASIQLCRLDQSGRYALVGREDTHVQETGLCYLEKNDHSTMTPDEIRLAVQELCGIFEDQCDLQELRQKKAV